MIYILSEKESERTHKARLHDQVMSEKYRKLHGQSEAHTDYHYWYEERTDKPGYYRHDYPFPYSDLHYFRRFAELFFSSGAEDVIRHTLVHEFPEGDEVDSQYIEGLLIKAEDYGFFTPGAMINFYGWGVEKYPPPTLGGHYVLPPLKGGFRESYIGSKANKQRAKVIRQWLKSRAAELAAVPSPSIPSPNSPWEPLLIGKMNLAAFFSYLTDCGLMTDDGLLTTLGQATGENKDRKAPWLGTLRALIDSYQLDSNAEAICRAMKAPMGRVQVSISANSLRSLSNKADNYLSAANDQLKQLGLLRK